MYHVECHKKKKMMETYLLPIIYTIEAVYSASGLLSTTLQLALSPSAPQLPGI
jgi:hypothetical protein